MRRALKRVGGRWLRFPRTRGRAGSDIRLGLANAYRSGTLRRRLSSWDTSAR